MIQREGYIEFSANDPDAWPEDRMTAALRQAPKPRVQRPYAEELARALERSAASGNLSPSSAALALGMAATIRSGKVQI